ncbi:MAG: cation-translocating P-type ATPase, partial [Bacteroidota bacterium]
QGEVDEAAITGESFPRAVGLKEQVVGGTLLVQGNLQINVTAIGQMTVLSRIIDLVKQAQADKPPIQQLADRISAVFVPVVLTISTLTFLLAWGVFDVPLQAAIIQAVAVLVVSCPCAMGLATPTAVVVGLGRATKAGILIRGGRTLEEVGKLTSIAFDKTGTLTTGAFQIGSIHTQEEESWIHALLLGLEQHSSHPIALSIQRELAGIQPISFESVTEIKGLGMQGISADGDEYQVGSFRLAQGLTDELNHHLYLLKNGALIAMIDLKDEVRPEAATAIAELKAMGLTPILLSGDQQQRCEEVAKAVGIQQVYAEQMPQDKLQVIEQLTATGPVAMIGDGINDAPALAKAQVGISLGEATDIAQQSAEVVLLGDRLEALPELVRISRHTVTTIRQNLFWAFFYNVLAIPVAALGYLQPILATAAMAFSDVMVIGNSLRLKVKRLR